MGFQYQHITLERRTQVGLLASAFRGSYGLITNLSRELGTSRKFIYELRDRVSEAMTEALAPRSPGPAPRTHSVIVDRRLLDRAILTLGLVGHASERGIADCLEVMYGVEPSLGYISGVFKQASQAAEEFIAGLPLALKEAQVEADELFAAGKAHLVAVAHQSLLILALQQPERCDGPTWLKTLKEVQERGAELRRLGTDGGEALAKAVGQLQDVEQQLDLWPA